MARRFQAEDFGSFGELAAWGSSYIGLRTTRPRRIGRVVVVVVVVVVVIVVVVVVVVVAVVSFAKASLTRSCAGFCKDVFNISVAVRFAVRVT